MDIAVRGKNIEVTPALVSYARKKLGKLAKFFDKATKAQVVLSVTRDDHIVEVTVHYEGLILRGEESTGDMYASIDMVVDKLEKQVAKYKTRLNKSLRQGGVRPVNEKLAAGEHRDEEEARVVRTKRFPLKPMSVEEAILQMNLLGHDFFVFGSTATPGRSRRNASTDFQCVVARLPSSQPAAASTNAPVQIEATRVPGRIRSRAAATGSGTPPARVSSPSWEAGTTTVPACSSADGPCSTTMGKSASVRTRPARGAQVSTS